MSLHFNSKLLLIEWIKRLKRLYSSSPVIYWIVYLKILICV